MRRIVVLEEAAEDIEVGRMRWGEGLPHKKSPDSVVFKSQW
jgi:hypothetical protein